MNINSNNKLFQLFVADPLNGARASYESDEEVPRVIVDAKSIDQIDSSSPIYRIEERTQLTILHPFDVETEEQFNHYGITAILRAHDIWRNEATDLMTVKKMFLDSNGKTNDVGNIGAILMSPENRTANVAYVSRFCYDNGIKLFFFPEIVPGVAYCLPEPEFFGVIPIETVNEKENYAIGIINSRPIVKVFIGEPNMHWRKDWPYL
jgi:hypothetical protein